MLKGNASHILVSKVHKASTTLTKHYIKEGIVFSVYYPKEISLPMVEQVYVKQILIMAITIEEEKLRGKYK